MCTFIIYARNNQYLAETIHDLIDKTPPALLQQIVICDENGVVDKESLPLNEWDHVLHTKNVGRSRAYNLGASVATEDILVFLQQPTKFTSDWLPPLLELLEEKTLVSPITHLLDTNLWSLEDRGWRRYGMRWDFTIHNRKYNSGDRSPVAAFCMVIHAKFLLELEGFDGESGPGSGDNICLSLKTWLAGGEVKVADDSHIGVVPEIESGHSENIARLVEAWFSEFSTYYYDMSGQSRQDVGDIDRLVDFAAKQERTVQWWLENLQPELLGVHALRGLAKGKRIAVVADGPSLDYIDSSWINNHDLVIAVDFLAEQFKCDYVVSGSFDILSMLDIPIDQMVVPYVLESRMINDVVMSQDVLPGSIQVELMEPGEVQSVFPPFHHFGSSMTLLAMHFALFLGPESITLFGCDNKILDGRSHTTLSKHYNGGKIWADSEQTRQRFNMYEYGLNQLSKLALRSNIPLLRVGHA